MVAISALNFTMVANMVAISTLFLLWFYYGCEHGSDSKAKFSMVASKVVGKREHKKAVFLSILNRRIRFYFEIRLVLL